MKLNSGVKHVLVGGADARSGAGRPTGPSSYTQPRAAAQPAPASRRAPGSTLACRRAPQPARPPVAARSRTLAVLGLAASAALLGCSTLSPSAWRVEPVFRVEGGSNGTAAGYLALAQKYEGEGRAEQALDAYARAAKGAPDSAEVQNTLGLALARHGRIEAAITALRRAVALAPERAPLLNNLAYALLLDGRADEARAMFRLTLAVDPAHEIATRNLAHLNRQQPATVASAPPPAVAPNETIVAAVATAPPAAQAPVAPPAPVAPVAAASVGVEIAAAVAPVPAETMAATAAAPPGLPAQAATGSRHDVMPAVSTDVSIEIMNGNGVGGAAMRMRDLLHDQGIHARRVANLPPYKTASTQVLYRPGLAEQARWLAQRMPVDAGVVPATAGSTLADLRIVIGHDARHRAGCTALGACAPPERSAAAADHKARRL